METQNHCICSISGLSSLVIQSPRKRVLDLESNRSVSQSYLFQVYLNTTILN